MARTPFENLQEYLGDPAKAETRRMWEAIVASELGPEERKRMTELAPTVTSYLSGEIDRQQYETEMQKLTVPQP